MADEPLLAEDSTELRRAVIDTARAMNESGINVNKAGNVSVRCARGRHAGVLITPTALGYGKLQPADLVFLRLADGKATGGRAPSSEWRFHLDIHRARPELAAVLHTHSPSATALACHGRGIPPFHYMVAVAGGTDIRCAPYATFGTQELSDRALAALAGRRACLLAHHGVIACESSLPRALALAIEVEQLARIYLAACALGEPPRLADDEMARVLAKFEHYGQPGGGN
jgi:L-fuculose-phosphate aldolase